MTRSARPPRSSTTSSASWAFHTWGETTWPTPIRASSTPTASAAAKASTDGETEAEPLPASKFISKGFSRGAAPDNLVFLPFGGRRDQEPRAADPFQASEGGDVCPACGDLALSRKGGLVVCDSCGTQTPVPTADAGRGDAAR
jgi:hypothetical protein